MLFTKLNRTRASVDKIRVSETRSGRKNLKNNKTNPIILSRINNITFWQSQFEANLKPI